MNMGLHSSKAKLQLDSAGAHIVRSFGGGAHMHIVDDLHHSTSSRDLIV